MDVVGGVVWDCGDELGNENGCHGPQEDSVAAEESKELCG